MDRIDHDPQSPGSTPRIVIAVPACLQATSRRKIASQIRTCESCASGAQCDSALRSSGPADSARPTRTLSALSR